MQPQCFLTILELILALREADRVTGNENYDNNYVNIH